MGISSALEKHFFEEDKKIKEFMTGGVSGMGRDIQMSNGQILERYTLKFMKEYILQPAKENGFVDDDDQFNILYRNGKIAIYGAGDDTSKMSLNGIKAVIYQNANTDAYAGKDVTIENWNETEAGKEFEYGRNDYGKYADYDDWRMEFA